MTMHQLFTGDKPIGVKSHTFNGLGSQDSGGLNMRVLASDVWGS